MHTSNKKRFNTLSAKEFDEWCDRWYDFDYDYDCDSNCPCCARSLSENEIFFASIAEIVADIIIKEQNLNADIKPVLVEERTQAYTRWQTDQPKMNERVREDIAFIWPRIKDTKFGFELFARIFGQHE